MNRKEKLVLVKNAAANVVRGGAAAMVAIILPPFLTRLMSAELYGTWSLVLQLSAYVGYLDFGIQTAVGRFVAQANEMRDADHRDQIVSTAFVGLTAAGVTAIGGTLGLAVLLPRIFQHVPSAMVGDARVALLLVAASLAIGLPASVFNGVFVGLQHYEIPAAIIGGSRILSAFLVILVVKNGGGLTRMAGVVGVVNLASYAVQYLIYRWMAPEMRFSAQLVSRKTGRELLDYCSGLTVWSLAMLLVTGLDVLLVGYFQFEELAYYAVAATIITFLSGLQNAVFGVMIPSTAIQHARGDSKELGRVMITATRYGTFLVLLTGLPLVFAARHILSLWVGPSYALHGARILQVLVLANMVRLSATPYAITLVGTGQQRLAVVTALLEASSNLLVSIIAGYVFGAVGVAIGTLFGSFVGVGGNLFYNMRRTAHITFHVSDYLRDGLLRPAICALPPTIYVAAIELNKVSRTDTTIRYLGLVAALLATVCLIWRYGLLGSERDKLRAWPLAPQA
jgi:O-antigen/teichoic acid export membrane protein